MVADALVASGNRGLTIRSASTMRPGPRVGRSMIDFNARSIRASGFVAGALALTLTAVLVLGAHFCGTVAHVHLRS